MIIKYVGIRIPFCAVGVGNIVVQLVNLLLGLPQPISEGWIISWLLCFWSSPLWMCLRSSRQWFKHLHSCYLSVRSGWSWLLISASPSPSCCDHVGSKPAEGRFILSLSAFQIIFEKLPLGMSASHIGVARIESHLCFWFSFLLMQTLEDSRC